MNFKQQFRHRHTLESKKISLMERQKILSGVIQRDSFTDMIKFRYHVQTLQFTEIDMNP